LKNKKYNMEDKLKEEPLTTPTKQGVGIKTKVLLAIVIIFAVATAYLSLSFLKESLNLIQQQRSLIEYDQGSS